MNQITINEVKIDVIRKNIKNIHLAVYPPTGRTRIAVPTKTDDDTIRRYAISKLGWIKRNQRKIDGQDRIPPREYKQREGHYYQGKRYLLNIVEAKASPKVVVRSKKYIELHVRPGSSTAKRHEIMSEWYRTQLKIQCPALIQKWEKVLGVTVRGWQIKSMKTKWGSCNAEKGNILLNLELAKKPEQCLEYIIVHEMVHLLERRHNDRFLCLMDKYLPNWRQLKTSLNRMPVSHANWRY